MKVIFSTKAEKQFRGITKTVQIILARQIRGLTEERFSKEEKLSGFRDIYRIRAGDYRIVYRKSLTQIFVILIGHRKEIYRLLRELLK